MNKFEVSVWLGGQNMGSAPFNNAPFFRIIEVIRTGSRITATTPALKEITDKRSLPYITPAGTFSSRRITGLQTFSGLINADIDHLSPQQLTALSERLKLDQHVVAFSKSFSGKGLSVYIYAPIFETPEQYSEAYRALEKYFLDEYQTQIDPACKDCSRARFLAYDPDAYIGLDKNLKQFRKKISAADKRRDERLSKPVIHYSGDVPIMIEKIVESNIDITKDYADWLKIAFAIAGANLPNGRELFHAISQRNPNYDAKETDYKYDSAAQHNNGSVGLGSVVWLARQYGMNFDFNDLNKQIYYSAKNLQFKGETSEQIKEKLSKDHEPARVVEIVDQIDQGAILAAKGDDDLNVVEKVALFYNDVIKPELIYDTMRRAMLYKGQPVENMLDGMTVEAGKLFDNYSTTKAVLRSLISDEINNPSKEIQYNPIMEVIEPHLSDCDGAIDELISLINFKACDGDFNPDGFMRELAIKRGVLKKWFIGIHAQMDAANKRAVNEIMPIFITPDQGVGKTQAVYAFLPEELREYVNVVNMGKTDAELQRDMESNIILINDELYGTTKREINRVKMLLSLKYYNRRDLFKDNQRERMRTASFIGLSNDYLVVSEDRNRRFIPLELFPIKDDSTNQKYAIRHDILHANNELRLKVFAEGYKLYKSGAEFWLDTNEREWIEKNLNTDYKYQTDAELVLADYCEKVDEDNYPYAQVYTSREIAEYINDRNYVKIRSSEVRKVLTEQVGMSQVYKVNGISKRGWRLVLKETRKVQV